MTLLALSSGAASGRAGKLLQAARDGNAKLAITLAESGADVQQSGDQGETALHWAAFHGLHALARALIVRGADVDARVRNGNTPLHQAAYKGHLQVVELLVARGATVGAINRHGLTATQWAQRNGHAAVLRYLVAHGGRGDGLDSAESVASRRAAEAPGSSVLRSRKSASGEASRQLSATVMQRLNTRLGDLPPLVLKVPDSASSAGPSLELTRKLKLRPSPAPPLVPPAPAQGTHGNSVWIQLGAFRTQAHASTQWRNTISAHQDLVSGLEPTVVSARVGAKGTFYRLRVGPLTAIDARGLCAALEARQAACRVIFDADR